MPRNLHFQNCSHTSTPSSHKFYTSIPNRTVAPPSPSRPVPHSVRGGTIICLFLIVKTQIFFLIACCFKHLSNPIFPNPPSSHSQFYILLYALPPYLTLISPHFSAFQSSLAWQGPVSGEQGDFGEDLAVEPLTEQPFSDEVGRNKQKLK